MTDQARRARNNAIPLEVKKDGLQQRQDGSWVLRLTVAAVDMHQTIVSAAMGTRFQCALVEINDDETPVDHVAIERDKWRALGPTKQSALRCKDPVFRVWLHETFAYDVTDEHSAAHAVRALCHVSSRSELSMPGKSGARTAWHNLDNAFQAWKVAEHA